MSNYSGRKLSFNFFNRNSVEVAKDLLGCLFVTNIDNKKVIGKIIETEAYSGSDDLACHASKGRTPRTDTLFGPAGKLYIYLNYGIFHLTNVVCDKSNYPSAVLIRSAQIIHGKKLVRKRLQNNKFVKDNDNLASGPGKFSIAFGITKDFHTLDITKSDKIYIEGKNYRINENDVVSTARVGVDYAKHCKDYPWRFYLKDNTYVSKR